MLCPFSNRRFVPTTEEDETLRNYGTLPFTAQAVAA